MKIGTRSVLFGAHQFLIHPVFLFFAWWKLFGFPWDPRLWVAFVVHDLGYFGKPNMDGEEGETHPYFGACVMRRFGMEWYRFTLYHSRFLARKDGREPSALCAADKLAVALEPWWLYLPRVALTGELTEYMSIAGHNQGTKYSNDKRTPEIERLLRKETPFAWCKAMRMWCRKWAMEHRDTLKDYGIGVIVGL